MSFGFLRWLFVGPVLFVTEAGEEDQADAGENEEGAVPDDEHKVGTAG